MTVLRISLLLIIWNIDRVWISPNEFIHLLLTTPDSFFGYVHDNETGHCQRRFPSYYLSCILQSEQKKKMLYVFFLLLKGYFLKGLPHSYSTDDQPPLRVVSSIKTTAFRKLWVRLQLSATASPTAAVGWSLPRRGS